MPSDSVRAVLFDFSGTLASLEHRDHWFAGMDLDRARRAELTNRMTHPTATGDHGTWDQRDLDPQLHREAYLHVLRDCGLSVDHAEQFYARCIDPSEWELYPDAVPVLKHLRDNGIRTAVVSNIAWDIRAVLIPAGAAADEYVLSYEVGAVKPDPRIFEVALARVGVDPADALMIGDSDENDGAARLLGCSFALVDPLPVAQRPGALIDALRDSGVGVPSLP